MKRLLIALSFFLIVSIVSFVAAQEQEHIDPLTSECRFTANQDIIAYNNPNLTERHAGINTMQAGWSFKVVEVDNDVALVAIDHAMGFWVEIKYGEFSGNCDDVGGNQLNEARTLNNTRLWSQPDVTTGEIIASLPEGATVTIIGGTVIGPIRLGSAQKDTWYPVRYGAQTGWVWSGRLNFDEVYPPNVTAVALENARLWSQPDVVNGDLLVDIGVGTFVEIVDGPATGRIQYDNTITGVWYQVSVNNTVGWVWENRLKFE